ncbi:Virulence sensor protein BvgS [Zhongshania aliphaticivorans]|uniref:histidine kinase n=1 Tax=Zhongshania aliphaticivorans TaxID=1470434 RepID=A0A5S9NC29_9GAMM|nr:ATP-binding protein [Zhongshania aliphaticivorans]CAA0080238.1 Virulence sensor protein BvgS [Zhongshania aliphaticivorans]CAA0085813.1 Virulence sensor protein BvgS [Zhongshania aliphaticivorans]
MSAQQRVFRIRRKYNRWVANETLEDYALRFTAKGARRWSVARVSNTALGAISFLALEAIGGAITLSYGFSNTVAAVIAVSIIIFLTGLPICYHAARQGVDIDLLTRGAGFGYIGSTITSLIYASFTFIFFAIEAAIMALALELTMDIPLKYGYVISAVVVIPLVTHGITLISRFQVWTQPLWVVLQILPLVCIAFQSEQAFQNWVNYSPPDGNSTLNLLAFGAASAVILSLIAQIGEQVDFLRFLPQQEKPNTRWWIALIAAGPGWIISGSLKILIGSFLAVLALSHGIPFGEASDPNRMYLIAFGYLSSSPQLTLVLAGSFVILSQLKINVTNAYAGSIAWSNFFSRLTHNHPGRVVWLVFNVAIALMLMELGIYRILEEILTAYSIIALAWVGSLVADLTINRPLGLRPSTMEFKRAHLYDINPVGVGSMLISSVLGFLAHLGQFGETAEALASFIALGSTFILAPLICWLSKGQFYIAREPVLASSNISLRCCICYHQFESEDMTHCPAYTGAICSLCCSLDSRCHDMCKTNSRMAEQLTSALSFIIPNAWIKTLNTRTGHFIGLFTLISFMIASVLALVYIQITIDEGMERGLAASALNNVFYILLIVSGILAWMFALVHDSRRVAQEESQRQTELLMAEIEAHKQTDIQLQQAKEIAESANQAKTRYLTGISHELRSPLNAIMGYAQLLEKDPDIPRNRLDALKVIRRSSEHLADLIEGLLDISRIEAGRLELSMSDVNLGNLLEQIISMFQVQAQAKGIGFSFDRLTPLPETVKTDEKRLRQILINLISNAIKYTPEGRVNFTVSYRNQVAEFRINDTGVGIAAEDIERVFKPFERVRKSGSPHIAGTGLGLTITRLLTDIMGGDIAIHSQVGVGSEVKVSLMLSSTDRLAVATPAERKIIGYEGSEQTLFVVDDEPSHRGLLNDTLTPLGFKVITAADGNTCLDMLQFCSTLPRIFLLDISMPGISGWELAAKIRERIQDATIIMISANAAEVTPASSGVPPHDAYLFKPIRLPQVLDYIAKHAGITWLYESEESRIAANANATPPIQLEAPLSDEHRRELIQLAKIGYAKGIKHCLETISEQGNVDPTTLNTLQDLAAGFQFGALIDALEDSKP